MYAFVVLLILIPCDVLQVHFPFSVVFIFKCGFFFPLQSKKKKKTDFIPYRDSVLTWLLRENLGMADFTYANIERNSHYIF